MGNLRRQTTAVEAIRPLFSGLENRAGNHEPGDICPDRLTPILTQGEEGAVLRMARRCPSSPPQYHSPLGNDHGVTNLRNMAYWAGRIAAWCLSPASPNSGRANGRAMRRRHAGAPRAACKRQTLLPPVIATARAIGRSTRPEGPAPFPRPSWHPPAVRAIRRLRSSRSAARRGSGLR